jgi:hypothetical protein
VVLDHWIKLFGGETSLVAYETNNCKLHMHYDGEYMVGQAEVEQTLTPKQKWTVCKTA